MSEQPIRRVSFQVTLFSPLATTVTSPSLLRSADRTVFD